MRQPVAQLFATVTILAWYICLATDAIFPSPKNQQHPSLLDAERAGTSTINDHFLSASSSCTTSADCAFNGECVKKQSPDDNDPEQSGSCQCFPGWIGDTCEVMDVLPVETNRLGLKLPNHESSTWGGSVLYDNDTQLYHMFASEIINDCGLYSWTTNSRVIRATSKSPFGPYRKEQVIVPIFAHDSNVIRSPSGEWVLFVTALTGVKPRDCRNATTKIDPLSTDFFSSSLPPPKDTYMLWAEHPEGPWSKPVMVMNSTKYNSDYWSKQNKTAICDTNLNGIILPNSKTFVGIWRHCETDELLTIPHLLTATDWRNASTYIPHLKSPLFVLEGSGAEDPSNIWITRTSDMKPGQIAFHVLFHDEQATRCMLGACGGLGRHAYSLSDTHGNAIGAWRYATVNAYDRHVLFDNGTILRSDTRARPHVILDASLQRPIALSNGLKEREESGYCWTVVVPLRTSTELEQQIL
ncbi:hypothetical protein IV203_026902 [Nitzschia inconspicua]|uniref:EGF-like domain-containing protein n=1 Tax=Nitzschia inconspicua TaxID=303405 RepID=A0A9K3LN88_9STRA|nr:hypothetical protein IV203_026902 [Nitzschia inconspicua]